MLERSKTKNSDPQAASESHGKLKAEPGKTVALNFKVPAEVKKSFKIAAATHEMTQSQILVEAFKEWQKKHG